MCHAGCLTTQSLRLPLALENENQTASMWWEGAESGEECHTGQVTGEEEGLTCYILNKAERRKE